MIICMCQVTTEAEVDEAIREGASCVDSVGERCGAGMGCGGCHEYLELKLTHAGHGAAPRQNAKQSQQLCIPLGEVTA